MAMGGGGVGGEGGRHGEDGAASTPMIYTVTSPSAEEGAWMVALVERNVGD